jgi:hypothetical protein
LAKESIFEENLYKATKRKEQVHRTCFPSLLSLRCFNATFVAGTRKNIGMVLAERGEYEEAMSQFDNAKKIYLSVNDGSEMNHDVASAI